MDIEETTYKFYSGEEKGTLEHVRSFVHLKDVGKDA